MEGEGFADALGSKQVEREGAKVGCIWKKATICFSPFLSLVPLLLTFPAAQLGDKFQRSRAEAEKRTEN